MSLRLPPSHFLTGGGSFTDDDFISHNVASSQSFLSSAWLLELENWLLLASVGSLTSSLGSNHCTQSQAVWSLGTIQFVFSHFCQVKPWHIVCTQLSWGNYRKASCAVQWCSNTPRMSFQLQSFTVLVAWGSCLVLAVRGLLPYSRTSQQKMLRESTPADVWYCQCK